MSKNRTGKTALEVFTGLSLSLKYHAPRERNVFLKTHAVKTTNFEGDVREQLDSPLQNEKSYLVHRSRHQVVKRQNREKII